MAQNVNMTVGIKSDLTQGQSIVKFLNDLAATGNKTAKALQGVNLGGTGAQKGALAKALLEDVNLFKDLGKASEQLSRILNNTLAKSTEGLQKDLADVNRQLRESIELHTRFSSKIEALKRTGGSAERIKYYEALAGHALEGTQAASAEKANINAALGALAPGGKSIWTKDLMGGALGDNLGAMGLGGLSRAIGPAMIAGLIGNAVRNAVMGAEDRAGYFTSVAAEHGDAGAKILLPAMAGSYRANFALREMFKDPDYRNTLIERQEARWYQNWFGGSWDALKSAAHGDTLGIQRGYARVFNSGSADAQTKLLVPQLIEQWERAHPGEVYRAEVMGAEAPSLNAAAHRLGSMRLVDLAREMSGGKTGSPVSQEEILGLMGAIKGRAGRGMVGALAGTSKWMYASGVENAGSIAGGTAIDMRVAQSLGRSGLDPTTIGMLGEAIAQGMSHASMSMGGMGRGAMLSWGLTQGNSAIQLRELQQNMAGERALSGIFAGHDAFQRGTNLANAIGILGPGANIYSQQALSRGLADTNMLASAMRDGTVPEHFKNLGIGLPQIEEMVNTTLTDNLQRVIQSGDMTPTRSSVAAKSALQSGNVRGWIQKNKGNRDALSALASAYLESDPGQFKDFGEAMGYVRLMGGLGGGDINAMRAGGGGGSRRGADTAEEVARLQQEQHKAVIRGAKAQETSADKMVKAGESFVKIGEAAVGMFTSAKDMINALGIITGVGVVIPEQPKVEEKTSNIFSSPRSMVKKP